MFIVVVVCLTMLLLLWCVVVVVMLLNFLPYFKRIIHCFHGLTIRVLHVRSFSSVKFSVHFLSRPMKIVTFLWKNDYPPKRVV